MCKKGLRWVSVCTSGRKSGKLDNLQSLELVLEDYFKKKKNKNGGKLLAQANHGINTDIAYDPTNVNVVNIHTYHVCIVLYVRVLVFRALHCIY